LDFLEDFFILDLITFFEIFFELLEEDFVEILCFDLIGPEHLITPIL